MHSLPKLVSNGDLKIADQLMNLVERDAAAEDILNASVHHPDVLRGEKTPRRSGKTVPGYKGLGKSCKIVATDDETVGSGPGDCLNSLGRSLRPYRRLVAESIKCYHFYVLDHIAANYSLTDDPLQCDNAYLKECMSLFTQVAGIASCQSRIEKQMCVISIDGKPVTSLLDSDSIVTLVKGDFVNPAMFHPSTIVVICIHGNKMSLLDRYG